MNLPADTNLPFFAYGTFKRGQLCFPRIQDFVDRSRITSGAVPGLLKERDGIPLLIADEHSRVTGDLIYFHQGQEVAAYQRILDIEPGKIYRWDLITVNDEIVANCLLGKSGDRGSSDLEHCHEWDGRSDPFFKQGLEEVEEILKRNSDFDWEYRSLIRLQMAYALLWIAIERYAGLKYHLGNKAMEKIVQIADEQSFAVSLRNHVTTRRSVFSTSDLTKYELDPENPKKSILYYYQVRSNAIHRGKAVIRDFDTVKASLTELLAIFKDVLDSAFAERHTAGSDADKPSEIRFDGTDRADCGRSPH